MGALVKTHRRLTQVAIDGLIADVVTLLDIIEK